MGVGWSGYLIYGIGLVVWFYVGLFVRALGMGTSRAC